MTAIDELTGIAMRDYLRQFVKKKEQQLIDKCTNCRYAKVCNHRKNVPGFEVINATSLEYPQKEFINFIIKYEVRFRCDKFKPRKKSIPFEETRIWKLVNKENQNENH